jgi:hypothetical protein
LSYASNLNKEPSRKNSEGSGHTLKTCVATLHNLERITHP